MLKKSWLVISIFLIFVTGCMTFKHGDETFSSGADALKWQAEKHNDILKQIKPVPETIPGKALIAIPSDTEIRKKFISTRHASEEAYAYVTMASRNEFQFIADAIGKSQMYDAVSVTSHNGNINSIPTDKVDYLIYIDVDGWFIRGNKSSYLSPPITFKKHRDIKELSKRVDAFLNDFHEQARIIRNKE